MRILEMKRYLSLTLAVLVVGIGGTWYWAGHNYQKNVSPLITTAISNSPVKITYDTLETSPFTFTTEFKNLKVTYSIPEGSDLDKSLPEIVSKTFKGNSQFFKDVSHKSIFEINIPGKISICYNPITNSIKIHSPSKAIYSITNPNSKVSLYTPEDSQSSATIGLANRQILLSPIVLEQDPVFGPIPSFLSLFSFIESKGQNYKIIDETSGKPLYTLDKSISSLKVKNNDTTKTISIGSMIQNSQFHKIEGSPFVADLILATPQLFSENPGKMELDLSLDVQKNVVDFIKSPNATPLQAFSVDLKKFKSMDKYADTDLTFNIDYNKKFFSAKGQTTSVVHVDRPALIKETMDRLENQKSLMEESEKQNINIFQNYITALMPDLKALSPLKLVFDIKVPTDILTHPTLDNGHINLEFDTKEYGLNVSATATQQDIRGQINLKDSELFLNNLSDFASRAMAVASPAQKPVVDLLAPTLKPIILDLATPDATGKNHTIKVTFDKKTQQVMVGSKNLMEVMSKIMPLLAPLPPSS